MKIRVCQCWDDGVATDARLVKILKKYHAKATFNLCPGVIPEKTQPPEWAGPHDSAWSHNGFRGGRIGLSELREIYGDFQVASHCWKHEVAGTLPDSEFIEAAVKARKFLENTFQKECRGFAWPCGASTPETVKLLRDAGFIYGRTTKNTNTVLPCAEPLELESSCHFLNGNFWRLFEEAKKTTGIFYFWGHSYEMYEYDALWKRTEEKIATLSADPDVEWIDVADLFRA